MADDSWVPDRPTGVPDEVWDEIIRAVEAEGADYERRLAEGLAAHDREPER